MIVSPFGLDDISTKKTRADGSIFNEFARTKAAKTICAKMQLAIEVFDSREDKPDVWFYENGFYHPGGAQLIGHFLDEVAQDLSDSENISDVLRRVRGNLRLQPVEFDITNPYLVGCRDGITLDLQTGKARKAAPTDLISMPIPVKYDPEARCPEFIKFLEGITATDDDRLSIIDFLASLLIVEPMDFFVAAPGLGSNGRSKLKDFIRAFVGSDACRSIPLKNLSDRFTAGFLTRTRVNFCNETEIGGIILEFIKRSSEKMPVEQKWKGMVNAILYLKYFFDTNTMPAIVDTSYGAERRICRWDLPWRFCDNPQGPMEKERDADIIDRITTPVELSGVLNLVLKRAPDVIQQKIIHHRNGSLLEYALQSRSGDIFLELFLQATINDKDRVHTDTIRTAYQRYCTITNSSLLGIKSLRTLIQEKTARLQEENVRIGELNRRGYKTLKFDSELFEGVMTTLEKARAENKPIFSALLAAFPDLQNTTNTTVFSHNTTSNTNISNIYCSVVVNVVDNKKAGGNEEKGTKNFPQENSAQKTTTTTTITTSKLADAENRCSDSVVQAKKCSENSVVQEFLADGGQASKQRFLAEFPEASGGSA